ncbi:uncharacterized protein A4U43_C04F3690 [Asparagus officinalis]|uniref:Magnesium transporter n=1 Tax=Asparagus officinalis TaxID=4686 RepID=A0A5P1F3G8_ASPOF|nr:uncharacterized protein A4U43_C04F3690 [Asparagus officinalis]
MKRTGLPARDMRVLDPLLSYPSTILGRERAIVINLEHIKAIVTAAEVLVPNSKDPMVGPFVQDLRVRVSSSDGAHHHGMESSDVSSEARSKATSSWPSFPSHHVAGRQGTGITRPHATFPNVPSGEIPEGSSAPASSSRKDGAAKVLPFEFRALEVCLESACRCLESETSTLEKEAYPALDELTSKLSTLNLERVRQLKSRLVAISGRVQKVSDELEHLLDDDMDMAEMYLSEKLSRQLVGERSAKVNIDGEELEQDDDSRAIDYPLWSGRKIIRYGSDVEHSDTGTHRRHRGGESIRNEHLDQPLRCT